jgi:chromate reductase, NAD(P)H dehydrogenase (quinone)
VTRLLGISGSLRAGSWNTTLLRAAQQVAGTDVQVEIATLHGIPLYDGDLEAAAGIPAAVKELKQRIIDSDGVLLATPEYNGGIPGVMKNGIDWLSRPGTDIPRVFRGRPFALLGATPGGFGTVLAQNAWLPILKQLGVQLWSGGRIVMSHAPGQMDAGGAITDEAARKQVTDFVQGFAAFAAQSRARISK